MTTVHDASEHAGRPHAHPPHLAHHFGSLKQQYDSGKLGMWIFLATEILMFGGLFCAYGVYRANHPEIFSYAHHYLDTNMGALNTVILIASSFTMAWAVRASQLGQKGLLVVLLALTFLGGCGFMVVKGFEYEAKFSHGLWPGRANVFYPLPAAAPPEAAAERLTAIHHLEEYYGFPASHAPVGHELVPAVGYEQTASPTAAADVASQQPTTALTPSVVNQAPAGPTGVEPWVMQDGPAHSEAGHGEWLTFDTLPSLERERVHMFFQVYFMMTGLHGLHVLIGMALIGWLLVKAILGAFSPTYFAPVDLVGLYWHLVDLIWIFLFPLLYLIH